MDIPIANICRTCLQSEGHLVSIFDGKSSLAQMVTAVAAVQISSSDELPKKICLACVSEVNRAYSFRIKCENSDTTLRQFFKDEPSEIHQTHKQINSDNINTESSGKGVQQNQIEFTNSTTEGIENISRQMTSIHEELSEMFGKEQKRDIDSSDNSENDDGNDNDAGFLEQETGDDIREMEIIDKNSNIDQFENEAISDKEEETVILGCADCSQTFDDENKFQAHSRNCAEAMCDDEQQRKHKKKEPIKCNYCPFDFVHQKNLDKHIKKYHEKASENQSVSKGDKNENQTLEEWCSTSLNQKVDIIDLKPNQKYLNTPFKCLNCGAGFAKEKSLSFHLKLNKCTEKQFGCASCKKVFINKENLIQHMKMHTTFQCSKCTKSFSRQDKLKAHIDVEHNGVKNNLCPYCNKVFTMQSSLKDHIRTHSGEKPFLCSLCGKAFSQSTNLKQHMMRHTKTKPFKCNQCDYSFVSKGELNSHIRKHTGDHPFVCDTCGSNFTTSSSLVKHKRRHTGERPYACEYCPMRFSALGILKNHRRTHTGEKPFVCQFCQRSFAQRSDCISHMRTHTGEKPYICSVCGVGFQQSGTLKSHLKSIHNIIYKKDAFNKIQQQTQQKCQQEDEQHKIDSEVLVDILAMQVDNDVLTDSCLKGEILQR